MIKLSLPHLAGKEKEYVDQAIDSTWIVPLGPFVDEFERRLDSYLGENSEQSGGQPASQGAFPYAVALSAGTAAIHLGLVMAGIKAGDEVVCQSLTFSASCNPIVYLGAKPVFVDSELQSWNMDPELLEQTILDRKRITGRKPAAIVVVHLYGMPARLDRITEVAERHSIPVVEDAAEALGSEFKGKKCGTFGGFGALSFNGNKIITTSGGGALICHTPQEADRVRFLATQARENRPYYYHETIGYNYRLSNISAAIGCAQIEELPERVARRREIHDIYAHELGGVEGVTVHCNPSDAERSNFWLSTMLIDPTKIAITPDELRKALLDRGIETRLLWRPMHMQPVFADAPFYKSAVNGMPEGGVGEWLFDRGLCLPSGSSLTDGEVLSVVDAIREILNASVIDRRTGEQ